MADAPLQAQSADGVIHQFPAGTDMSVVDRVMKSYAADGPQPAAPDPSEHWAAPAGGEFGNLAAQSRETAGQSQIGADVNAAIQGAVSGTGSVIAGIGRQPVEAAAQGTQRQLAVMDAIDQGKDVPQDQDAIGYQFFSREQKAQARADFTSADVETSKREPNAFVRAGTAMEAGARTMFPVSPENEGYVTGTARMVGGMGPALLATAGGTAVGGPVGGVLAGAAMIGSQAYDGAYQEAIGKGATPKEAEDAAGNSALGQIVAMSLPIGKVIPLIPVPLREGFVKTLVRLGQDGVEFGGGNVIGTLAQNYVAQQSYDPSRSLSEGLTTGGLEGTAAGLVIRGGGTAIRAAARPATVGDIAAAPDLDSAIAAAGKVAEGPPAADTTPLNEQSGQTPPVARDEGAVADPQATSAIPKTSADAKAIASAYYAKADAAGGTLLPDFTNRFIDKAESIAPQTTEGRAIAGDTAITGLVDRIQALRDQPISLAGAQEIDESLGDMIDKEYGLKGMSKEGRNLLDLQTTFRNMILDAGPADTANGTEGFDAIKQGRAAWAQAMKMGDLERILNRAEQTDNPVTSIRAGVRALTSNPARMRGYSPEEVEALKDAASRGVLGGALHVFGSRLTPLAVGAAGLSTGFVPALIGAGVAHGVTTGLRNWATSIQTGRANNAMSVLGAGVPPPPQ